MDILLAIIVLVIVVAITHSILWALIYIAAACVVVALIRGTFGRRL